MGLERSHIACRYVTSGGVRVVREMRRTKNSFVKSNFSIWQKCTTVEGLTYSQVGHSPTRKPDKIPKLPELDLARIGDRVHFFRSSYGIRVMGYLSFQRYCPSAPDEPLSLTTKLRRYASQHSLASQTPAVKLSSKISSTRAFCFRLSLSFNVAANSTRGSTCSSFSLFLRT